MREVSASSSAQEPTLFAHEPLDITGYTIRLVRLLPDTPSSPICCEIQHLDLTATYACLSYVWGSEPATQLIYINGKRFFVRQNLYEYLLRARHDRDGHLLWIDAICIDQENIEERNHQVALMGQIYSLAQFTDVWLGFGDSSLEVLFDLLDRKAKSIPVIRVLTNDEFVERPGDPLCNALIEGTPRLHDLEYWSRLWIMQEFVLTQRVRLRYGTHILDCDMWFDLWKKSPKRMFQSERMSRLLLLRYELRTRRKRGLTSILAMNRGGLKCDDKRDQIYGVLGLATEGETFKIDYNESVEDLFLRALNLLIPATTEEAEVIQKWRRSAASPEVKAEALVSWREGVHINHQHEFGVLRECLDIDYWIVQVQLKERYYREFKVGGPECQALMPNTDDVDEKDDYCQREDSVWQPIAEAETSAVRSRCELM